MTPLAEDVGGAGRAYNSETFGPSGTLGCDSEPRRRPRTRVADRVRTAQYPRSPPPRTRRDSGSAPARFFRPFGRSFASLPCRKRPSTTDTSQSNARASRRMVARFGTSEPFSVSLARLCGRPRRSPRSASRPWPAARSRPTPYKSGEGMPPCLRTATFSASVLIPPMPGAGGDGVANQPRSGGALASGTLQEFLPFLSRRSEDVQLLAAR